MLQFLILALTVLTPTEEEFLKKDSDNLQGVEKARWEELAMRKFLIDEGGMLLKPGTPRGTIIFVNCGTKADNVRLEPAIKRIKDSLNYDVRLISGKTGVTLASAGTRRAELDTQLAIFIVESDELPAFVTCPDEGFALVNVAKLADEKTKPGFLAARLRKEMLRAYAYMTAGSSYGSSLYNRIDMPEKFDDIASEEIPVDLKIRTHRYLSALGYKERQEMTYRELLALGCEIMPTNDYQKAIWDKVHSIPSKPMKITFDPAAQKPVVK